MIVILKRISATTRVHDIESFIEPVLQGGFLKKTGRIESLKISLSFLSLSAVRLVASFIGAFMPSIEHLSPQFQLGVNAYFYDS